MHYFSATSGNVPGQSGTDMSVIRIDAATGVVDPSYGTSGFARLGSSTDGGSHVDERGAAVVSNRHVRAFDIDATGVIRFVETKGDMTSHVEEYRLGRIDASGVATIGDRLVATTSYYPVRGEENRGVDDRLEYQPGSGTKLLEIRSHDTYDSPDPEVTSVDSQTTVRRLRADGTPDPSYGTAGSIRLPKLTERGTVGFLDDDIATYTACRELDRDDTRPGPASCRLAFVTPDGRTRAVTVDHRALGLPLVSLQTLIPRGSDGRYWLVGVTTTADGLLFAGNIARESTFMVPIDVPSGRLHLDDMVVGAGTFNMFGLSTITVLHVGANDAYVADKPASLVPGSGPRSFIRRMNLQDPASNGNDVLSFGHRADRVHGHRGDDRLAGGAGSDSLFGGPGDDQLVGNAGADTLDGGPGADLLVGGSKGAEMEDAKILRGGAGRDSIIATSDVHLLQPGVGADTVILRQGALVQRLELRDGEVDTITCDRLARVVKVIRDKIDKVDAGCRR
ncbi:MAG: hemolysin-type calcium-binding region protein [Thermoleophilia bacterium]|nr:hemolysin-type calcium-binding region protein [Thermoleophilia bacterium]